MKKKHYSLLVVIYVLLFVNLFFVYREKDISNFYNNFDYFQSNENKDGFIYIESTDIDKQLLLKKLYKLSSDSDISFVIKNNIRQNNEVIRFDNYYVGNEDNLKKLLPKNLKINFNDFKNGKYLSNKDKKDTQRILTFYEVEYNIYPIDKILEEDFPIYTIDFYHNKNYAEIKNIINNELNDFSINIDVFTREEYNLNNGLIVGIVKILVIMFVLSSVSSLFFISNNLKIIGIYKLNGIKKLYIWEKIYLKYMISSLILSVFIPIAGFLIIFGTILGRVTEPLIFIILAGILLALINLIISIIFVNIISKIRVSEIIKGRNINKKLTMLSYILVIVSGIIIVPVINDNVIRLTEGLSFVNEKYFSIKDHSKYNVINIDKYIEDIEVKQNIIDELDTNNALIKFEPTSIFSKDLNNENRYLAFFINEVYLNNQKFQLNNRNIDLSSDKDVIIFMDEKTFNLDDWTIDQFVYESGKSAEIKFFDDVSFENYSDELVIRYSNYKPIFIYIKNDKNYNTQRLIINSDKIEVAKNILINNGIKKDIEFINGKIIMNQLLKETFKYFTIQIISIIPFLLTFYSVSKTLFELIKITNKKKWTIQRIFGYSKVRIYLDIFIDILIIIISMLLSKYLFSNISIYSILGLLMILFIVYIFTIFSINNMKLNKEVKHL